VYSIINNSICQVGHAFFKPDRKKPPQVGRLVETEDAVDRLNLGRLDQFAVRNLDRVQGTLELRLPEVQELLQYREIGENIVILPDVLLQEPPMVGPAIKNMCRREPVPEHLLFKVFGDHDVLPWCPL
jgi:hypothetical protein